MDTRESIFPTPHQGISSKLKPRPLRVFCCCFHKLAFFLYPQPPGRKWRWWTKQLQSKCYFAKMKYFKIQISNFHWRVTLYRKWRSSKKKHNLIIRSPDTERSLDKLMETKPTQHQKIFLKGEQRATHPEFDRDGWALEEIVGEKKDSLWLQDRQPLTELSPWQRHDIQNHNKMWLFI